MKKPPLKVLVVDGDLQMQSLIEEEILRRGRYIVGLAESELEAQEMILQEEDGYSFVIVDCATILLHADLVSWVKHKWPLTKVILMVDGDTRSTTCCVGVDETIHRPLDLNLLPALIKRMADMIPVPAHH